VNAAVDDGEEIEVRMLLVDDEPDMLMLMRATLELDAGLVVTAEARDGDEAVRAWEKHQPDVIVMDMRMPRMTGLAAAEEILAKAPTQPIIMCSAYMDESDRRRADALGVRQCLDKYDLEQLPAAVRRAVPAAS
jgi:CheY-like chemotaxis protein